MAKFKVVVTDLGYPSYDNEKRVLEPVGAKLELASAQTEDEVIKACKGADGILNRVAPMTARVITALDKCRVIARYGVGVDNVDVQAAAGGKIVVANVPDYCNDEVSTHAVALLLALARKVVSHDKAVRNGAWDIGSADPIYRTAGRTVGLIGLGRIARAVAEKLKGFGMRIVAADPYVSSEQAASIGVELIEMDALIASSDFISIHAPLMDATKKMINAGTLSRMKPTACLVNTSRGGLVDQRALIEALNEKKIAGAALDVYEVEPLEPDSPLKELDNVILTDHAGWYSEDSIVELQTRAAQAVADVLSGRRPESVVNPQVYE
ncbi:MAG: C-terminal binding protein [Planctomycetota bacterium]|jgi:D-3-phosphoglycerate dehydrogenase